ncbi:MAG: hypothetical protein MI920_32710 [Kiloniellales bacterium]|nr:hypothetical protein [Kiloniellales bacterium]
MTRTMINGLMAASLLAAMTFVGSAHGADLSRTNDTWSAATAQQRAGLAEGYDCDEPYVSSGCDAAQKFSIVDQARHLGAGQRQGVLTAWPWTIDEFEQMRGERYEGARTAWPFAGESAQPKAGEETVDADVPQS